MYTRHAEFKAGAVVILALAAILALVYFAGGAEPIWGDWRYIHIRFEQGFVAPKVGDPAQMNGVAIGRISRVMQREEIRGEGGQLPLTPLDRLRKGWGPDEKGTVREIYVVAEVKMRAAQIVPAGTTAQIEKTLTGIRVLSLLPGDSSSNLTDGQTHDRPLPGTEAPGLADISGKISELAGSLEGLVSQGGEVMMEAKTLLRTLNEKIDALNTVEMDRDARAALAALRRTLEQLEKRIDNVGGNLEEAAADIKKLAQKAVATIDRIDSEIMQALASFKSATRTLDEILQDAKPEAREILANLKSASENAAAVTKELAGIGPEARRILAGLGVDVDTLLRNLIDTSRNLLDTSEDVRAHPYKLLNKPDDKEVAYENVRAAAFSYMRAMRDLNDASRRLGKLLERTDLDRPEIRELLDAAVRDFQAAQERYRNDEARWQRVFRQANPKRPGK